MHLVELGEISADKQQLLQKSHFHGSQVAQGKRAHTPSLQHQLRKLLKRVSVAATLGLQPQARAEPWCRPWHVTREHQKELYMLSPLSRKSACVGNEAFTAQAQFRPNLYESFAATFFAWRVQASTPFRRSTASLASLLTLARRPLQRTPAVGKVALPQRVRILLCDYTGVSGHLPSLPEKLRMLFATADRRTPKHHDRRYSSRHVSGCVPRQLQNGSQDLTYSSQHIHILPALPTGHPPHHHIQPKSHSM